MFPETRLVWRNVVGFLRLKEPDKYLDRTRIHPDFYVIVEKLTKQIVPEEFQNESVSYVLDNPTANNDYLENLQIDEFIASVD